MTSTMASSTLEMNNIRIQKLVIQISQKKEARAPREYGEEREGYWASEKFVANVTVAEFRCPPHAHSIC